MTDHIGAFSIENDIELSWMIELGVIYDENKIGQWQNRSTGAVYIEMILNFRDWLDRVPTMKKSKQDNGVMNHIGLVYAETKT